MSTILYISAQGILHEPLPTAPTENETVLERVELTLPISIQGTNLVVEEISAYEGPYLEDGSDREVVDIMALHVYNAGPQEVLKTFITICIDGQNYAFYGEHIPSQSMVVLLERSASKFNKGTIIGCGGWQVTEPENIPAPTEILVTDRAMGTLVVTNTGDEGMENIRIYYKAWLSPPDVYMGGITYTVTISKLLPGQTQFLYPDHYASGFSKVVSVRID